jgi:hypothetical protein
VNSPRSADRVGRRFNPVDLDDSSAYAARPATIAPIDLAVTALQNPLDCSLVRRFAPLACLQTNLPDQRQPWLNCVCPLLENLRIIDKII